MIWGREESEWDELAAATTDFLVDRAKLERKTSYTELNSVLARRTGARRFDFEQEADRAAIGALLGQVAREQLPDVGALISAIVIYLNANDAGTGFYRLAEGLNLLPTGANADQRLKSWIAQLNAVYAYYRQRK